MVDEFLLYAGFSVVEAWWDRLRRLVHLYGVSGLPG